SLLLAPPAASAPPAVVGRRRRRGARRTRTRGRAVARVLRQLQDHRGCLRRRASWRARRGQDARLVAAARRRERRARHGDHGRADDPAAPRPPPRGELQGPAIGSPPKKNSSSPRKRGPIPQRNVLLDGSPPRGPPPRDA